MVSKRQQLVAIAIILILVPMAIVIGLLLSEPTQPSPNIAEKTIIGSEDLSPGWKVHPIAEGYYYFSDDNINISCYAISDLESDLQIYVIRESLTIFNSTYDCNQGFHLISSGIASSDYTDNYSAIQIGDRGFTYEMNEGYPGLVFQDGNIICTFETWPSSYGSSVLEELIDLSIIQLQKIDQYLASHPGAS